MRLAPFIQQNLEPILKEWDSFASTLLPAAESMTAMALRDHARQILQAVAADMQTAQSEHEQKEKSLGEGHDAPGVKHSAATIHGALRYEVGFDLVQLVAEYRALRASVLRLWIRQSPQGDAAELNDLIRFNEAIDQAIAESVAKYSSDLDTARDTFMAILGHDLRSPLSAIAMSAHNASAYELSPTVGRAIAIIQRAAVSMQVMIRDLLDVAGARLGRGMPLAPKGTDLGETCQAVLSELRAAHPKRIFEFEQAGNLAGSYDPERIGQVLSNLLNNAVNHGDADRAISMRASGEDPEDLVVEVKNRGKTITADELRAIMDPSARKLLPGSERSSGLGLGLYIAREVAEAHGGSVKASSNDGITSFVLRIPRTAAAPVA
jgi:signal transduction histidine kinase